MATGDVVKLLPKPGRSQANTRHTY